MGETEDGKAHCGPFVELFENPPPYFAKKGEEEDLALFKLFSVFFKLFLINLILLWGGLRHTRLLGRYSCAVVYRIHFVN